MLTYLQLENLKERIEEESEKKSDGLKALSKAQAEIQLWKSKFETEGLGRIDELESGKQKLNARLAEAEETIENLNQKVGSTEKTKHRLETELEDLQLEYERVHAAAIITEKRGRNFDKVIGEWKAKVDDLTSETEARWVGHRARGPAPRNRGCPSHAHAGRAARSSERVVLHRARSTG